jgi:hypothetical protein
MKDAPIHQHKRKRYHRKPKEYPHPDPKIRLLDNIVTLVAIIFPFTALPQLYNIWVLGIVAGVSVITWTLFLILTLPLLVYVIVHKEKPFIIMYCLWLIVDASIVAGILLLG